MFRWVLIVAPVLASDHEQVKERLKLSIHGLSLHLPLFVLMKNSLYKYIYYRSSGPTLPSQSYLSEYRARPAPGSLNPRLVAITKGKAMELPPTQITRSSQAASGSAAGIRSSRSTTPDKNIYISAREHNPSCHTSIHAWVELVFILRVHCPTKWC